MAATQNAAIGFTVKSGWAAAVLLSGPAGSPRVIESRRIEISDPRVPDSTQPYHAGFGTARDNGDELRRLVASVKAYGRRSVTGLLREYQQLATVRDVGVVAGSLIDPEKIANDHIRIHAMEGRLFRTVIVDAAEQRELRVTICRERDLYAEAVRTLKRSEAVIRKVLADMGRGVDGGWRSEQKAAALSAWIILFR